MELFIPLVEEILTSDCGMLPQTPRELLHNSQFMLQYPKNSECKNTFGRDANNGGRLCLYGSSGLWESSVPSSVSLWTLNSSTKLNLKTPTFDFSFRQGFWIYTTNDLKPLDSSFI